MDTADMKNKIILDVFFYVLIPLLVWNFLREVLGNYYAILFGAVPSVIYTAIVFIRSREWSVTGIFFLSLISINFLMDLRSNSADSELWNKVWIGCASVTFYALTLLIRRPMGMYLFIDYAYLNGIPRKTSAALYRLPKNFHHFIKFTLFLMCGDLVRIAINIAFIKELGVDGFGAMQLATAATNYIFIGLTALYVIFIIRQIKKVSY